MSRTAPGVRSSFGVQGAVVITCRECGRVQDKALCGSCRSRRYGRAHRAERARWVPIVAGGEVECSRWGEDPECPGLIDPAAEWDLDHRPGVSAPAHSDCNRRAGARSLP